MNEEQLVHEIVALRTKLREKESNLNELRREKQVVQNHGLNNEEISRYSRQILLPEISVSGQVKIKNASVLIVGAGGLGCPSALYLAGAGVGHIGIIDYDDIEINNLHRQLLYCESDIGLPKAEAAAAALTRLNSNVRVTPYKLQLDSSNALNIVKQYDIVLDATDNVPTRYLLNDACVLAEKPLVSGSALKLEGQLSVFNYKGPCYRCIFPKPPPPETVTNCGDGGILGAVVGTIGVLQAVETLKIILEVDLKILNGRLLLYDASEATFRNVRLRGKNPECAVCGKNPTIENLIDYEQFCRSKANDKNPSLKMLDNDERISVEEYNVIRKNSSKNHVLIDVRSPEEFEICRIEKSINVPFAATGKIEKWAETKSFLDENSIKDVYVLCRRGNDSQRAVKLLKSFIDDPTINVRDIIGGIHAWSRQIDPTFPIY
ncbi:adenylyltransferase and sulfurtransferase MOCS3 [Venturia canescens]|uniref:adenylyltransferase and sulfurtransferase MOCS3 n=1 Tax=Venturia canescens TaxID=32260 RepID=UPI001C9C728B|nr:adenylyltransferase and sulfurtransferase MOCS3 [Venturia canescens]